MNDQDARDREFAERERARQHDEFEAKQAAEKRRRELRAKKDRKQVDEDAKLSPEEEQLRQEELDDLEAELLDNRAPLVESTLAAAFTVMQRRADGLEKPLPTPWPSLNRTLGGGLWPGLHIITGTTGSGKTQMALQIALRAAHERVPVLYVALELGSAEIAARLLAITMAEKEGRAPMWSDLYLGKDAEGARRAREQYAEDLVGLPLRIEEADAGKWTAADLSHRVGALRRSFDPAFSTRFDRDPLVILDYLQLVGPEEERQDLRECIRTAAIKARNVARHGATVLLLSSVSRENAKLLRPPTGKDADKVEPLGTGDPSRLVGLGKESGEIEFSADTVLSLGTEAFNPRGTTCHLAAAKVRAGLPAWVRLTFNGSSFSEAAGAAPQREEDDL